MPTGGAGFRRKSGSRHGAGAVPGVVAEPSKALDSVRCVAVFKQPHPVDIAAVAPGQHRLSKPL
jgi:hypothetical protein